MAKARKPLQFWIINDTRDTTLENLKYDKKSHSPLKLRPKMLAGDSHLCEVPREPGRPQAERLVLYEANSFTLAIFVHIEWKGPKRLQLELSHDKAHLGEQDDLDKTFSRMSEMRDPPDTDTTAVTRCELQDRGEVSTWLFAGAYKLTATLSYHTEHILKVQLEERD